MTQDEINRNIEDRVRKLELLLQDAGGGNRVQRLDDSQAHQAEAIYNLAVFIGEPRGNLQNLVDAKTHINAVNTGKFVFPPKAEPAPVPSGTPKGPARVFSVWTGARIPKTYTTLTRVADGIKTLAMQTGQAWDVLEWIVKVGEAGTWQYEWDKHPLAPDSLADFQLLMQQGHEVGITVIPYFNVRGHAEWNTAEWNHIAGVAQLSERVVLNLEPGHLFWDAPGGTAVSHHVGWWDGLRDALGSSQTPFELAAIPRPEQIQQLGGVPALKVWLDQCAYASWECYANMDRNLGPDIAIPYIAQQFAETDPRKLIPICVFSGFAWWANNDKAHVRDRLEVWTIDAD